MLFSSQIQMGSRTKMYSYHCLYTPANLVADIGGNLGLFLGLSVFSCVQVVISKPGDGLSQICIQIYFAQILELAIRQRRKRKRRKKNRLMREEPT